MVRDFQASLSNSSCQSRCHTQCNSECASQCDAHRDSLCNSKTTNANAQVPAVTPTLAVPKTMPSTAPEDEGIIETKSTLMPSTSQQNEMIAADDTITKSITPAVEALEIIPQHQMF